MRDLFDEGLRLGLDPTTTGPENEDDGAESVSTTTLRSPWLHRSCSVCFHTFRPGDQVRVVNDVRSVVHDMPGLHCASGEVGQEQAPENFYEFYEGLDEAWPMRDDVEVTRLETEHPLLIPRGERRHACRVCGHTLRRLDHVVVCPCGRDPENCLVGVHRDVVRQMHCYDEWRKGEKKEQCLAMT